MESTINQREAIQLLKEGKNIEEYTVTFNDEKIEALNVMLLRKNNVEVPEDLIYYDDDSIDYSDDPDITDEDFETGRLDWNLTINLPLDEEIKEWIKKENIDINRLAYRLIKDFYETMKNVKNNEAI